MVIFEVSELGGFAFSSACLSFQGCPEAASYWRRRMVTLQSTCFTTVGPRCTSGREYIRHERGLGVGDHGRNGITNFVQDLASGVEPKYPRGLDRCQRRSSLCKRESREATLRLEDSQGSMRYVAGQRLS